MNAEYPTKTYGEILVVDDRLLNSTLLFNILTDKGYEVRQAMDGPEAIKAVFDAHPDIILLDIVMPGMDGYEVCEHLKQFEDTAKIPIIFLSALDSEFDKVKAFEVGGVDYITKPFKVKEVLARVEHQLMLQTQRHIIASQNLQLTEKNEQLQELNNKLVESNRELEEFAYIVSHDLQSPLHTTMGFARLLGKKYENILDGKAKLYIDRILEGGNRMNHLIDDLLEYSRVQTRTRAFEPINLNSILEEVLSSLEWAIQKKEAEIICDRPLPEVMGDSTQLQQLFQNLIGNAIKFQPQNRHPKINIILNKCTNSREHITALTEDFSGEDSPETSESQEFVRAIERPTESQPPSEWLIGIQDNGIGIPTNEFKHIFQICQRLHTDKEYPGTGIGLTICKKIVERHGGKIWLQSKVDVGTTFYFTFPMLKEGTGKREQGTGKSEE